MKIQEISPKTKQNIRIIAGSAAVGTCMGWMSIIGSNVKVTTKDIFQYSKLSAPQKKVIKTGTIGGLIVTALIALEQFIAVKNAKNITDDKKQ